MEEMEFDALRNAVRIMAPYFLCTHADGMTEADHESLLTSLAVLGYCKVRDLDESIPLPCDEAEPFDRSICYCCNLIR